jgi:hypothetical protein
MDHLKFITDLAKNPEIQTNPERHFGPNYKMLINFWIYWENLSLEQLDDHYQKRGKLHGNTWRDATRLCKEAAESIVSKDVYHLLGDCDYEIVACHCLINAGILLTFIPLTQNL